MTTTTRSFWRRPGVAEVLFVLVALSVFRGARHTLLDDPGLGWHLRNIDAMFADGGRFLFEDPFTDPRGGEPARWYSNQWLGEMPYWLGWKWAGLEGIAAVNALIIAVMAGLLYRMLLSDGLPWPVALAWTALGVMGTSCSWNARPNVFTILFVLITARACVRLHEGKLSLVASVGLAGLFAVWANTHGGFVAGLILLVVTLAIVAMVAVTAPEEGRTAAWKRLKQGGLLGAGAFFATWCNPYGPELYGWVFQLLGDPYFMTLHQEWRSPDFLSAGAMRYELLILLFPAVLALSSRRPNLVELGLSVAWLHFALGGFRYVALWVVVAVPLMARSSAGITYLHDLAKRLGVSADEGSLFHTPRRSVGWAWSFALGVTLLVGVKAVEGRFATHKQEIIASRALDRFLEVVGEWQEQHGRRAALYHDYKWGGYLTWHGWPTVLNWIDDRNEVQGKEHIQEHIRIEGAEPGWEAQLGRIDLLCIDVTTPLARELSARPGEWRERYRDGVAVIFERVGR